MTRSRALVWTSALLALAATAGALAQSVIAHEYVPNAGQDEGSSLVSSASSAEPAAIVYDGALIPPPAGGALHDGERPMRSLPGDGSQSEEVGRRSATFRPDRVTALPGAVGYFEVFSPSITPYKRVTALDGVALAGNVPVLAVADVARGRVVIEGAGAPAPDARARDRFWGSVVLDFSDGDTVPLPSVSPESRILTLRTEPSTVVMHLERDHADNFFAVLDPSPERAREVRVIFLTDAPRTYFGFDDGAALPTAPSDALVAEVPVLPSSVEQDALTFAHELGVSRGDPFDRVVGRLVEHFRAFEESEEPPADTGNIFLDLARGMRGVCRHRAYAFAITAMALGIPARFVNNEAHAWVEVHMPERRGWLRVDLGGSAQGLVSRSAERGPEYRPDVRDLLPQPEPYTRALSAAQRTSEAPPTSSAGTTTTTDSAPPASAVEPPPAVDADPLGLSPTPPSAPPRAPLTLALDHRHWEVLRGQSFEVTGRATSAGAPAEGVRIEVVLRDASGNEQLLGVTVSVAQGIFHASFGIPPDALVGERVLVVRSPASARFQAASVE